MRRLHIIEGDGIDYRHHEERFMRDPELRDAYECGYRKAYKEIMSEQYGGYGERGRDGYGERGGYTHRGNIMYRDEPMYRERPYEDDDYEERRRRSSRTGRYI